MIIYKANDNWFGDIKHLAKSWTMVRVMRTVLFFGVYTTIVWLLHLNFFPEKDQSVINSAFSFLGVVLSILLVFRTNSAYDRWWEGRKQWGALINNTRNLAVYAHTILPKEDKGIRFYLAVRISNFCHAMVEHLRQGTDLDQLIHLTESDHKKYGKRAHVPNAITHEIYETIVHQHREKLITDPDLINYGPLHKSLLDIIGACERIKKTPIPFSYAVFMKVFISTYGLLLPFALAPQMAFWSIPVVMLVMFAFVGIELMGEEIEDPFGLDCNNLPTGDMANTIQNNVFEIFELDEEVVKNAERKLYDKVF
ncbi:MULTISPECIES: bestrophin family protein [Flammeovirga]|uniref:Bestrophin n=1 Tax=Flammeovirga agarivorans TaxID=2726742 RepID=A0A7X8SNA0_9BACT|nr:MULTISPECIES: bestrophin family protein [Flammeovirga]NLR93295.1 bestrophin [Flammeovirga agarivorans]